MGKVRNVYHNGKGNTKHNDRTFDRYPDNIDPDGEYGIWTYKQQEIIWDYDYCDLNNMDKLRNIELEYYNNCYGNTLSSRNENYVKTGHKERCKSIIDWYDKTYPPEETILQVGTMFDVGNTEEERTEYTDKFMDCVMDFLEWHEKWNSEHGNHVHILSAAFHNDEASPHVHLRRVYDYTDKNGNLVIGMDKALQASGINISNPDKPPTCKREERYNNRKIAFDRMIREKWQDICISHGFDVIKEPIKGKRSLDLNEYAREQERQRIEKMQALEEREQQVKIKEQRISKCEKAIMEREQQVAHREREVLNLKQQVDKRLEDVNIQEIALDKQAANIQSATQLLLNPSSITKNYLKEKGLEEDFKKYVQNIGNSVNRTKLQNSNAGAASRVLEEANWMQSQNGKSGTQYY